MAEISIGTIHSPTGILALADVGDLDTTWLPNSKSQAQPVVDVTGNPEDVTDACKRIQKPRETLVDGTVRFFLTNTRDSSHTLMQLRKHVELYEQDVNVELFGRNASRLQAHDAARETGAGMFRCNGNALGFLTKQAVDVIAVTDDAGKVTELRLKLR